MTTLVTGVAGQDGILLARALVAAGTPVVGTVLPGTDLARLRLYAPGAEVVEHDIRDTRSFADLLAAHRPTAVFHLASVSSVARSWDEPELTAAVNGDAVAGVVDAILEHQAATGSEVRLFHASSAEVVGDGVKSPYGAAKLRAEQAVEAARDRGLFAAVGRLFPHESPLRSTEFVVPKIVRAAAEVAAGTRETLTLGNLEVSRDWGSAADHVAAMRLLLNAPEPTTVDIGTGAVHSLRELVEHAFAAAGVSDWASHLATDDKFVRPSDTSVNVADCTRIAALTGWKARTDFASLVGYLVDVERERLRTGVAEDPRYLR